MDAGLLTSLGQLGRITEEEEESEAEWFLLISLFRNESFD